VLLVSVGDFSPRARVLPTLAVDLGVGLALQIKVLQERARRRSEDEGGGNLEWLIKWLVGGGRKE